MYDFKKVVSVIIVYVKIWGMQKQAKELKSENETIDIDDKQPKELKKTLPILNNQIKQINLKLKKTKNKT
jgi:hypothetical protein